MLFRSSATRHQIKGCFTSQISCFLCEATNHIPAQCQLYPIVEQVRQEIQERMHHALEETLATRDSKKELQQRDIGHVMCYQCKNTGQYANDCPEKKDEAKLTIHPYTSKATTKCCYSCEEEGHYSRDCPIKGTRSSAFEIEYDRQKIEDLLALEESKKKRKLGFNRSEEHTSELQSHYSISYAVFCLKKKFF